MHPPRRLLFILLALVGLAWPLGACGGTGATDGDAEFALVVAPADTALAVGDAATLSAALTVDGTPVDGARYEWSVAPAGVVALGAATGPAVQVTGLAAGSATVTVVAGGQTATAAVVVTGDTTPTLVGVQVDPPNLTLPLATAGAVTATAIYSDGGSVDVTATATWTTSDDGVATIAGGDVTPVGPGIATLTATFETFTDTCELTVSMAVLLQIDVEPAALTLPAGTGATLAAIGTYDDSSTVDLTGAVTWTSSDESVATVAAGDVAALTVGGATITATLDAISGEATLTVSDATLDSLEVTPPTPSAPVGRDVEFAATGLYSDGASVDLTGAVTWTSSDEMVATVGVDGVATCLLAGTTDIIATAPDAVTDTATLTCSSAVLETLVIAPATLTVAAGRTAPFTVDGTYSDGQHVDLTTVVLWASDDEGVAQVSNADPTQGLLTALVAGSVNISASLDGVSDVAEVTVSDAELVGLLITPSTTSVPAGLGQAFTVLGTFTDSSEQDLTAQATWGSSDSNVASISNAPGSQGQALGLTLGEVTITATLDGIDDEATLTVTNATLLSIAVSPTSTTLPIGSTQAFTAEGTFSDASVLDVTTTVAWSVEPPAVASVSNAGGTQGLLTALALGDATITATQDGQTGSADVTVTPVPPALLAMRPAAGATGVRPSTSVEFRFSEAMALGTMTAQTSDGACTGSLQLSADDFASCVGFVNATPDASAGDTTFTLRPATGLPVLGHYRLRATTAAQSAAAIALVADAAQASPFRVRSDGPCADGLVISQIYGAGGNAGAPFDADFVELHNPTAASISLGGTAIQYAAAASVTWNARALPSVAIPAGGYFLIRMDIGAEGTPIVPDHVVAPTIAMSGTSAKVALTPTTTALDGLCPYFDVIDLVGYGAMASCADGDLATSTLGTATAALRKGNGCADSGVDLNDFDVAAPAPRGLGDPAQVCACAANETNTIAELAYCNLQFPSTLVVNAGELTPTVYGRVYDAGVTEAAGSSALLSMAMGFGASGSDPRSSAWSWTPATYNVQVGNDDEYQASMIAPGAGSFAYTSRVTRDGVNWTYCDLDGAGDGAGLDFATTQLGTMSVN